MQFFRDYVLHGSPVWGTDARGKIQITVSTPIRIATQPNEPRYVPISWVKSVSFSLGQLDHDWQSHHYRAAERESLVDQVNCAELHVADSGQSMSVSE